jgi:hypothetical protein
MSIAVQRRRGTTAENAAFTGLDGEITVDTDTNTLRVHDGSTAGGHTVTSNTATQTLTNKTLTAPVMTTPTLGVADATSINFGGTALSVYEEGSWTPVLVGSVTPGTQTYSVQVGRYVRIGSLVWVTASVNLSAFDVLTSGNMRITGLPYAAMALTGGSTALAVQGFQFINIDTAGGYTFPNVFVQQGQSFIVLNECGDNVALAALTNADFANNSTISVAGCYLA